MNYYESKMEMALAETLGVSSDTIEILNLTIENNIGNDDCSIVELFNQFNINIDWSELYNIIIKYIDISLII